MTNHFEVIQQIAFVCEHRGNRFAGIDHAPAAKADNKFTALLFPMRRTALNGIHMRLTCDRKSRNIDTLYLIT